MCDSKGERSNNCEGNSERDWGVCYDAQLHQIGVDLDNVNKRITQLTTHRLALQQQQQDIERKILEKKREAQKSLEPDWTSCDGFPWSKHLRKLAIELFGFRDLRPGQLEIMNATLSNYDVFSVLKTGGGKSLCYQLPALLDERILLSSSAPSKTKKLAYTVVISPLLSLIRDQVQAMNIILPGSALSLAGKMERSSQTAVYHAMNQGHAMNDLRLKLLYVTPEKVIKSKMFMTHLQRAYNEDCVQRIVIDEAHCASQWGHDFRPDYAKLHILRTVFPTLPMLLLTATANHDVRQDIITMLHLEEGAGLNTTPIPGLKVFLGDFDRPNLIFEVLLKPSNFELAMEEVFRQLPPSTADSSLLAPLCSSSSACIDTQDNKFSPEIEAGNAIVYCFSQKECVSVSNALTEKGVRSAPYHAGLEEDYRFRVQDSWVAGNIQVICATIAFGLGINMASVRVVVHFTLSKSLELYYQEAGRAGRDGRAAKCVLLYAPDDVTRIAGMAVDDVEKCDVVGTQPQPHHLSGALVSRTMSQSVSRPKVLGMIKYCHGRICRRKLLASSLDKNGTTPRLTCLQAALASASAAEGGTLLFLCDNCRLKRQSAHSKDQNTNYPFPMAHPMSPSPSTAVAHDSDLLTATKKDIKFILRTLLSSILEVVKDDFAECATRHDEKRATLTLKKLSTNTKIKTTLKRINVDESFNFPAPSIAVKDIEYLLASLLECGVLSLYYHFTPYASLCYLQPGHYFNLDRYSTVREMLEESLVVDVLTEQHQTEQCFILPAGKPFINPFHYHLLPCWCFEALRRRSYSGNENSTGACNDNDNDVGPSSDSEHPLKKRKTSGENCALDSVIDLTF